MIKRILCLLMATPVLFAGGPIARTNTGVPLRHPTTAPIQFNLDQGNLSNSWDHDTVKALVQSEFSDWDSVPGSLLRIEEGPELPSDVTSRSQIVTFLNQGFSPIVLDETGDVFTDFGIDPQSNVLAFAAPDLQFGIDYTGMFVVMGGSAAQNGNETSLRSTLLHEFGHALGLGHSQVNGWLNIGSFTQTYEDFGRANNNNVEIMYWSSVNPGHVLQTDDISGYLALYGQEAFGNTGMGGISGTIYMPDGVNEAAGVNVTVRDRSGAENTVFQNAAATITCCGENGSYSIVGLPPGEYSVEVRDIKQKAVERSAAYSDPIRTSKPGSNDILGVNLLGEFPGEEEFYNGASESDNHETIDDPTEVVTVTVAGNAIVSGIDIFINRDPLTKGSLLPTVYYLPEITSGGDKDTYIGIVNPSNSSAKVEVFGFTSAGDEVFSTGLAPTIDGLSKSWIRIRDAFPNNHADMGWVQVATDGELYVFGELHSPTTRAAYWATEGLSSEAIMPHVAKNTARFDTYISSVNGQGNPAVTTLAAQPNATAGTLDAHGVGYAKAGLDLQEIFGDDLTPIDWVRVNSDLETTASMEYFTTTDQAQSAALDLNNQKGKNLRFLHIATNTGLFWTGLVYINISDEAVTVTETYYNAAGEIIKTFDEPMEAGEKVTLLFDAANQERVPAGSSWMQVSVPDGSNAELVGYELFGSASAEVQDVFTGLRGNYDSGTALDFPHFQVNDNSFTAIVATNVGTDIGELTISAMGFDGSVLEAVTVPNIGPNQKLTQLMSSLFSDPDTLANAGWVRLTSSASNWSGFMLWGDVNGVRQHLSGMTAAQRQVAHASSRVVLENASHASYETAMNLTNPDGLNVNVVGSISQGDVGSIVNNCSGCLPPDDMEDVYTFTLTEPTDVLIAVAPSNSQADLDLIVVQGQVANQDFFVQDPDFLDVLDYGATGGGIETVARRFQAGTYYILVSLFEGDTVLSTDYGLLVSSTPLLLQTFEDPSTLANWVGAIAANDSNGLDDWTLDIGFSSTKWGNTFTQMAPGVGETQNSAIVSNEFEVPTTGITVFDFDYATLLEAPVSDNSSVTPILVRNGNEFFNAAQTLAGGVQWNQGQAGTSVPYNGGTANLLGWTNWAETATGLNGGLAAPLDMSVADALLGETLAFGVQATSTSSTLSWTVDNFRVFNIVTSSGGTKNKGQIVLSPSKTPKPNTKPVLMVKKPAASPVLKPGAMR